MTTKPLAHGTGGAPPAALPGRATALSVSPATPTASA